MAEFSSSPEAALAREREQYKTMTLAELQQEMHRLAGNDYHQYFDPDSWHDDALEYDFYGLGIDWNDAGALERIRELGHIALADVITDLYAGGGEKPEQCRREIIRRAGDRVKDDGTVERVP